MRLAEEHSGGVGAVSTADDSVSLALKLPKITVPGTVDEAGSRLVNDVANWVNLEVVYVFVDGSGKETQEVACVRGVLAGSGLEHDFYYLSPDTKIHGIAAVVRGEALLSGKFVRRSSDTVGAPIPYRIEF